MSFIEDALTSLHLPCASRIRSSAAVETSEAMRSIWTKLRLRKVSLNAEATVDQSRTVSAA